MWRKMFGGNKSEMPDSITSQNTGCLDGSGSEEGDVTIQVSKWTHNPTHAWERLSVKQKYERVNPMAHDTPIDSDKLRFVCVSDTHNRTSQGNMTAVPPGDVLLHAGDFTMIGAPEEVESFNDWLGTLPHLHKVVIAGNHEMTFDDEMVEAADDWDLPVNNWLVMPMVREFLCSRNVTSCKQLLTNCIYLEDSEIEICGIRIYGSPWQPWFGGWGFNIERGEKCLEKWNMIPAGVDVVMTHGPPMGHGDLVQGGKRAGCVELLHTLQQRVKPKYHIFGHIHEDPGVTTDGNITYINASTCTIGYRPYQPAIIFDLPIPEGHSKEELLELMENTSPSTPTDSSEASDSSQS